ncbi:MAG: DUF4279 domain-containing protein [Clostridia bacterium]|nr:DUF4279 domain-containing protein [Clostridia bacterium]MDD4387229.1 DUF4279 domain-containing protein [Clostridia bacterium]
MKKTNIKVEFSIYKYEKFDVEDISEILNITPLETYVEKDKFDEVPIKETSWMIETKYEESYDIRNQINKIFNLLKAKREQLKKISNEYGVNMQFMIVINVENGEYPGMFLDKKFIEFVAYIGGEIQFDTYYF